MDKRRVISWVLLLAFVGGATAAGVGARHDLASAWGEVGAARMLASGLVACAGMLLIGAVWMVLQRALGLRAPARDALSVFFLGQLGKYVPGAVWPVVAQMEFGRHWQLPRRSMVAGYALTMVLLMATGLVVGLPLLALSDAAGSVPDWLALVAVPLVVACAWPAPFLRGLDSVASRFGRTPLGLAVPGRAVALASLLSVLAWLLLGLHVHLLVPGASDGMSPAVAVGALTVAWVAGLLVIPAPAGAGIRDGLLFAILAGAVPTTAALAVVLTSRVLLLGVDVVLGGLALALNGLPRRTTSDDGRA